MVRTWPSQRQEPVTPFQSPTWAAAVQVLGPSSAAFLGVYVGSGSEIEKLGL